MPTQPDALTTLSELLSSNGWTVHTDEPRSQSPTPGKVVVDHPDTVGGAYVITAAHSRELCITVVPGEGSPWTLGAGASAEDVRLLRAALHADPASATTTGEVLR